MNATINAADVQKLFSQLNDIFSNLSPVMPEIGEIIVSSVQTNFEVGGRHGTANDYGGSNSIGTWTPSQRALDQGGQTLLDTGRLAASIVYAISGNTLYIGTNVVYAAIHQFGGTGMDGPIARPFLVIQNEDLEAIKTAVINYFATRIQAMQ
jgi:phage gpG-like protein